MSGVLSMLRGVVALDFRGRAAAILRTASETRAPRLEPWWQWSAYLAAAIAASSLTRKLHGIG